ncbi:MAG: hypothetical protein MHM6MM_005834, partial [Cercozoa sp. M6MM]
MLFQSPETVWACACVCDNTHLRIPLLSFVRRLESKKKVGQVSGLVKSVIRAWPANSRVLDTKSRNANMHSQSSQSKKRARGGRMNCICDWAHESAGFMIECERCRNWFHGRCLNITDARTAPKHFMCPRCRPQQYVSLKKTLKKSSFKMQQRRRIIEDSESSSSEDTESLDESDDDDDDNERLLEQAPRRKKSVIAKAAALVVNAPRKSKVVIERSSRIESPPMETRVSNHLVSHTASTTTSTSHTTSQTITASNSLVPNNHVANNPAVSTGRSQRRSAQNAALALKEQQMRMRVEEQTDRMMQQRQWRAKQLKMKLQKEHKKLGHQQFLSPHGAPIE